MPARILWVDDEVHLLKPQIRILEEKELEVEPVSNGEDALDRLRETAFDLIFLDEHMSGMSGLETLTELKSLHPHTPVIMITKSEEENLMEEALGSRIADYLIKPVNPKQVLLTVKKHLEGRRLVSQSINRNYQQDFRQIGMAFFDDLDAEDWVELYQKLLYWELELDKSEDKSMLDVLRSQKAEANTNFSRFFMRHYLDWMNSEREQRPMLSHDLMRDRVFPLLGEEPVFFILLDCMRYDQWKVFEPVIQQLYTVQEDSFFSILPTATQYARNSIFAGLTPLQIQEQYSDWWVHDEEEGSKNKFEEQLVNALFERFRKKSKISYHKILQGADSKNLHDNLLNLLHNDLNILVFNFMDQMAHARAELNLLKELVPDEAALRSLTRSWLEHSTLLQILKKLSNQQVKVIITTDHGSIRVQRPLKIIGDRRTTTNLRYKQGRNLNYDEKSKLIFTVKKPADAQLPQSGMTSTYAFAAEDGYFVYPNNYNHYVNQYRDTLQHGGISLEECVTPFLLLTPKS